MTRVDRHREEAVVKLDPICNQALEVSCQNHAPVALPPENDPVSIVQEARGSRGQSGWHGKSLPHLDSILRPSSR